MKLTRLNKRSLSNFLIEGSLITLSPRMHENMVNDKICHCSFAWLSRTKNIQTQSFHSFNFESTANDNHDKLNLTLCCSSSCEMIKNAQNRNGSSNLSSFQLHTMKIEFVKQFSGVDTFGQLPCMKGFHRLQFIRFNLIHFHANQIKSKRSFDYQIKSSPARTRNLKIWWIRQ